MAISKKIAKDAQKKYNIAHKYKMNNILFVSMQCINATLKTQAINAMWFRAFLSPAQNDVPQFASFIWEKVT